MSSITPPESQQRAILNQQLVHLLDADDEAASSLLDHLLTIDSSEDLLDYLSQLLGLRTSDANVQRLIQDIGKFQRGEEIEAMVAEAAPHPDAVDLPKMDSLNLSHDDVSRTTRTNKQNVAPKKQASNPQKSNLSRKKAPTSAASSSKAKAPPTVTKPTPTSSNVKDSHQSLPPSNTLTEQSTKRVAPRPPPLRGKAPLDCGCFGTYHQPLANCLYCGRIACTAEGYNFCPFCGYLVEQVQVSEELRNDPAWRHKERLLQFDREFASRTIVLDDMANYESDQVAAWLTPEQQAEAAQKEEERQDQLHKRTNMQLNMAM